MSEPTKTTNSEPQQEIAPKPTEKLINTTDWTYSEKFGPFEKDKEFKNPGIPQDHVDRAIMDGLLKVV